MCDTLKELFSLFIFLPCFTKVIIKLLFIQSFHQISFHTTFKVPFISVSFHVTVFTVPNIIPRAMVNFAID